MAGIAVPPHLLSNAVVAGDAAGHDRVGQQVRGHGDPRHRRQGQGAHGDEVQAADRQGEHQGRQGHPLGPRRPARHEQRGDRQAAADQQRGDDVAGAPGLQRGRLEGHHAEVVHQRHRQPEPEAGQRQPDRPPRRGRRAEEQPGAGHRHHQRADRRGRLIAGLHLRPVGQHGDEMGGPDAAAGGQARERQPGQPLAGSAHPGVGVEPEGREGRGEADQPRQDDQTQVVLARDTGQDPEHRTSPPSRLLVT